MATVNVYLTFNGNCRQAFEFYRSVFGGEFLYMGSFADMPPIEGQPAMAEPDLKKIMHVSLPISSETVLFGSDAVGGWHDAFVAGNNFSLTLAAQSRTEANHLFTALSEDGTVTMPLQDTFWGSYYGMCTDKFGINWMVSYDVAKHAAN